MMSSIENEDNREGFGCLGTEENVDDLLREKESEWTREIWYSCNSITCTLEFLALNLNYIRIVARLCIISSHAWCRWGVVREFV